MLVRPIGAASIGEAKIFGAPDYAAWRSLRESDDSKYVGLAMPRFLARLPYGAKTSPVEEFEFEEDTSGGDSSRAGRPWLRASSTKAAAKVANSPSPVWRQRRKFDCDWP